MVAQLTVSLVMVVSHFCTIAFTIATWLEQSLSTSTCMVPPILVHISLPCSLDVTVLETELVYEPGVDALLDAVLLTVL
jgi:hypothetical protein